MLLRMRRWLVPVLAAACHDDPTAGAGSTPSDSAHPPDWFDPTRIERAGKHVIVRHRPEIRVCAGDLAALDRHAEFLSEALDVPLDQPARLVWGDFAEIADACPAWAAGCAFGTIAIAGDLRALHHELAHVVGRGVQGSLAMWREGMATGLAPGVLDDAESHPLAMIEVGAARLDYFSAGQFYRWLRRSYDPALLVQVAVLSHAGDPEWNAEMFAHVYGEELEDVADRFLAQSRDAEPSPAPPEPPRPWDGDRWLQRLHFECENEQTQTSDDDDGLVQSLVVEVVTEGRYELVTSAGAVSVRGIARPGMPGPRLWTDPGVEGFSAAPGRVGVAELGAGLFAITATIADGDPIDIAIELHPALGDVPIGG